ncbi:MAG: GNAT family N-acetyltransferase, partial [Clostridia bacterium]|nr:GNAT family N-acetyltransferase [Clostridia bacterium]
IGTCGFTRFHFPHDCGEVGYVINPSYRDRGIATEALARVMEFGFERLGLHRIEAKYMLGNEASRRVMEKVGMRFEGVNYGGMKIKGIYRDIGTCAILAENFKKSE